MSFGLPKIDKKYSEFNQTKEQKIAKRKEHSESIKKELDKHTYNVTKPSKAKSKYHSGFASMETKKVKIL